MLRKLLSDQSARDCLETVDEFTRHDVRVHVDQQVYVIGFAAKLLQLNIPVFALLSTDRFQPFEHGIGKAATAILRH